MGLRTERNKARAASKKKPAHKPKKTERASDKGKSAHALAVTSLTAKVDVPGVGALDGGGGRWLAENAGKLFSGSQPSNGDASTEDASHSNLLKAVGNNGSKEESFNAEVPISSEAKKRANDYREELTDEEREVLRKKYFMTMHPDWQGMSMFNGSGLEPMQTVSGDDIAMSIQTGFIPSHVRPLTDKPGGEGSSLRARLSQLARVVASKKNGAGAPIVSEGVLKFVQDIYFPRVQRHLRYFSEQLNTDEGNELTTLMADISKSIASLGQGKRDYLPELLRFIQLYNKLAVDSGRGQMFVRPEIMRTQRS